jgi:imidazolonepropionase-like amidohydrolase
LACCLLAFSAAGGADEASLAIVGATVFAATGAAPVVETVLIQHGRIAAVGPHLAVPAGFRTIDATGEALLPGFFDLHAHWTPAGEPRDTPLIANADLAAGVTTSNDFNASPESFAARRAWLASLAAAPHVNFCGRLSTPGGHGADWGDQETTKWVSTPAGARAGVDAIVPYKPDCLGEVMTDGWRYGTAPDMTSMNADTIAALVEEAHKYHLPVLTHTVTVTKGKEAGEAKVDVIAHALQDRDLDAATIAAIQQGGGAFAPTLAVYEPNKAHRADAKITAQAARKWRFALDNTKRLYAAGVPVALGTDAGMPSTPHGKAVLREMELLVQAGLPASAALEAATANSARAMGEIQDRGTVEVGKRADLVLIQGTPWKNIADVEKTDRVFVDGKLVFGPGAPPPNPDRALAAVKVGQIVDTFERPDGRSELDTLVMTNPDHGLDRSVELIEVEPREDQGHALRMTARMAAKDNALASVVIPLTKGSIVPADLRGYRGLSFDLRGDGAYQVALNTASGSWVADAVGGAGWKTVTIPFSAFHHAGDVTWRGDDVTEIEIVDHRAAGVRTWLEMDNVSFY